MASRLFTKSCEQQVTTTRIDRVGMPRCAAKKAPELTTDPEQQRPEELLQSL
jgi:hypothetical protein